MLEGQYRVQCGGGRGCFAGERDQTLSIRLPDSSSWRESDEICAESVEIERARAMERGLEAETSMPEVAISFAESATQVENIGGKQEAKIMMSVCFGPGFDAGELRR